MGDTSLKPAERIMALDMIRVSALFCVIVFHAGVHFSEKYPEFFFPSYLHLGNLGVSLFIVLSGFSLFLNNKNESIVHFYKKRFMAIYPFYWIAYLTISMLIFLVYQRISLEPYHFIYSVLGLDGFLLANIQTQYLVGEWYVGFILLLYIVTPFVFKLLNKSYKYIFVFLAISLISIYFGPILKGHFLLWNPIVMRNPTSRIFEFSFGALLCILLYRNNINKLYLFIPSMICIAASVCIFRNSLVETSIKSIPFYISTFIVLYTVTNTMKFKQGINEFICFLSKYSFLAFLYHHQIILFLILNMTSYNKHAYFSCVIYSIILSYALAYITSRPCIFLKNMFLK